MQKIPTQYLAEIFSWKKSTDRAGVNTYTREQKGWRNETGLWRNAACQHMNEIARQPVAAINQMLKIFKTILEKECNAAAFINTCATELRKITKNNERNIFIDTLFLPHACLSSGYNC
jgi:hypothetical protein